MSYNPVLCVGAAGEGSSNLSDITYKGKNRISRYLIPGVSIEESDRGFPAFEIKPPIKPSTETQSLYNTPRKAEEPQDGFRIYVKVDRKGKALDPDEMRDVSRSVEAVLGDYTRFDSRATLYRTSDGEYKLNVKGISGIGADLKDHLSDILKERLSGTGLTASLEVYGDRDPDLADEVFELDNGEGPQRRLLESALDWCPSNRYGELSPREERAATQVELPKAGAYEISDPEEFEIPREVIEALEGVEPSDPRLTVMASLEKLPDGQREGVLKYIRDLETRSNQLELESRKDYMTGLGNRKALEEALSRESGSQRRKAHKGERPSIAVLYLDLNNLKALNDAAGHDVGDYAIRALGRLLESSLKRSTDSAYRVGGDEFVAVLPDTDESGAQIVAERLKVKVERTIRMYRSLTRNMEQNCSVQTAEGEKDVLDIIGVSIGVAVVESGESITPEKLLERADEEMRKEKATKRFNYRQLEEAA